MLQLVIDSNGPRVENPGQGTSARDKYPLELLYRYFRDWRSVEITRLRYVDREA